MLCKLSAKNQITLPKELLSGIDELEYFEARREGMRIMLEPVIVRPLEPARLAAIRDKVESLGITEEMAQELVAEARNAYGS